MPKLQRRRIREAGQTALAGVLCGLLVLPQAAFAAQPAASPASPETAKPAVLKRPVRLAPLTQRERVLHALNRFTFGPAPGEEAEVQRVGIDRWFAEQLQPQTIDDSGFEQRMSQFPALELPQQQLMQRFPSQAMVRMADRRGLPLPSDRLERALLLDAEYEYDLRQKEKALGDAAQTAAQPGQLPTAKTAEANAAGADNVARARRQAKLGMAALDEAGATQSTPAPIVREQPAVSNDMQASMAMAGGGAITANGERAPEAAELNRNGKPKSRNLAGPATPEEVEAVLTLPADQRVQRLAAMRPEEMFAFKNALRPFQRQQLVDGMTPADRETTQAFLTAPERVVGEEALAERLERDVFSQRQLQAVMTDFWLNHFSVYLRKNQNEPYFLSAYERDTILPNALGRFENLLVATAQSPAMLMYLDNWESVGPHSDQAARAERAQFVRPGKQAPKGINENYARELMELHTLGVNGGYTQQDVIEVAKCFTGWTIDKPAQGGQAVFDESKHEPGSKTVLGHTIKENGQKEGLEVLHILATSPATAHFISQKLAVRFVSDTPPPALVNRMAATFLKTDGNIKAVLLTMFHSQEFWSPQVYRAKVKTPIEFMASALRASGADVNNPLPLVQAMDRLGMPIFGMQTPNGYSWQSEDWVSSNALISRMNFALVLSSNRVNGTKTDWPALLHDDGSPVLPNAATENKLEIALLGEPASDRTRSTVLAQFGDPTTQQTAEEAFRKPAASENEMAGVQLVKTSGPRAPQPTAGAPLDTMAGLLLGSPEFQRR